MNIVILWRVFLGRKFKKTEVVHHIDKNTLNNNIDNLELKTSSEHAREHMLNGDLHRLTKEDCIKGRESSSTRMGSLVPTAKLNEEKVKEIKQRLKIGEKCRKLAREFDVDPSVISEINTGKIWKHVFC